MLCLFEVTDKPVPPSEEVVCITIHNAMSSVNYQADPAFDLPIVKPTADFLGSGIVRSDPISVPSFTLNESNNGGVYVSTSPSLAVDGIVAYLMPDGTNVIVIYFDVTQILFKLVPKGTELNDSVVKDVAENGESFISGSFAIGRTNYGFRVRTAWAIVATSVLTFRFCRSPGHRRSRLIRRTTPQLTSSANPRSKPVMWDGLQRNLLVYVNCMYMSTQCRVSDSVSGFRTHAKCICKHTRPEFVGGEIG